MRTDHRPHTSHSKIPSYSTSKKLDETSAAFEGIRLALFHLPSLDTKAKLSRQQRRDLAEATKLLTRINMAAPEPVWISSSDLVNG